MREKVRVLEKDFPAGIPNDIGDKSLEVINEAGETVALFWDTSFIYLKFKDPIGFVKHHDEIFNYWDIWEWDEIYNAGNLDGTFEEEVTEHAAEIHNVMEQGPDFFWNQYCYADRRMIALCRLTYPYHLRKYDQAQECYKHASEYFSWNESYVQQCVLEYADPRMIAKYLNTPYFGNHLDHEYRFFVYRFFYIIFGDTYIQRSSSLSYSTNNYTDRVYEYPEAFLTGETIDIMTDVAEKFEDSKMLAFLEDFKNAHFQTVNQIIQNPEPSLEHQISGGLLLENNNTNKTTNIRLSSSDFLSYCKAPRHLWASYNNRLDPEKKNSLAVQQKLQINNLGKKLIKKWILSKMPRWEDFVPYKAFKDGPYLIMPVSLLIKDGKKAIRYKIKSNTNVIPEDVMEFAFQALILRKYYQMEKFYVILVDNNYTFQGNLELNKLFKVVDITDDVLQLLPEIEKMRQEALSVLSLKTPDTLEPCWDPDDCICLKVCHPVLPEFSIFNIPHLGKEKKRQLIEMGIKEASHIPTSFDLSDSQREIVNLARSGTPLLDIPRLKNELNKIKFPLYFLDYEICKPAVPGYEGYKPYQQTVFQYSLHRLDDPAAEVVHFEHLSEVEKDPSLSLLASLKSNLGREGTVVVWDDSVEVDSNKEMAQLHPQYTDFLEKLNSRFFDLMEIVSNGIYLHPGFRGSNSIKDVLQVMVPELNYEGLEINDDSEASYGWWWLVNYGWPEEGRKALIIKMLAYGHLNSLAMVEIYRKFVVLASGL